MISARIPLSTYRLTVDQRRPIARDLAPLTNGLRHCSERTPGVFCLLRRDTAGHGLPATNQRVERADFLRQSEPYSRFVVLMIRRRFYRADWRLVDTSDRPFQPEIVTETGALTLVDQLNVADLADEAAHDYRCGYE